MQATFIHKLIIAIVAGFAVACLIQFYHYFIIKADESLNKGYNNRYGISSDR